LEALSVGGHEVRNIDVLILELPSELRIDGLLGMDFLGRFRTTVEPDTATVILRAVRVADG
jgi:predicted aspartyl protease